MKTNLKIHFMARLGDQKLSKVRAVSLFGLTQGHTAGHNRGSSSRRGID
jgi:hypothetical protein